MKKIYILSLLATLALLLLALPVQAAGPVQVSLTANSNELTVGDPVELTLSVTHPADYQPILPKLDPMWGEFEVRSQSPVKVIENSDGSLTTQQTINLLLFSPGTFQTPPFVLSISDGAGNLIEEVAAPVSLTVISTLTEGDTNLIDIRPQMDMPLAVSWPIVVGGLVLVVGLGWIGWRIYRRRIAQAADNRPPYVVALDELDRIEGLNLSEQGRYKELYTLITDCLRLYLEHQHRVRAFDRTTPELKQSLAESNIERATAANLVELFAEGDMVKFAKLTPQVSMARQAILTARSVVEHTRPQPETEEGGRNRQRATGNATKKRKRARILKNAAGGQQSSVVLNERS